MIICISVDELYDRYLKISELRAFRESLDTLIRLGERCVCSRQDPFTGTWSFAEAIAMLEPLTLYMHPAGHVIGRICDIAERVRTAVAKATIKTGVVTSDPRSTVWYDLKKGAPPESDIAAKTQLMELSNKLRAVYAYLERLLSGEETPEDSEYIKDLRMPYKFTLE